MNFKSAPSQTSRSRRKKGRAHLYPRTCSPPTLPRYNFIQAQSKLKGIASGPKFSEKTRLNSSKLTVPSPSKSKNLKAIYIGD